VGCAWCRRSLISGWWAGIQAWRSSQVCALAIIPLAYDPGGLRVAVRRLRRALRDLRDRTARHHRRWCGVCLAGLATGSGSAMVRVDHKGVDRTELSGAVRRRWPGATVTDFTDVRPLAAMTVQDAAELASLRRGAEPLRLLVLPQRDPTIHVAHFIEPMPVII
jgi:hypothetical protein